MAAGLHNVSTNATWVVPPCLQNLLESRAQLAAKAASSGTSTPTSPEAGQSTHAADLLRMTRESMNGSFSAKFIPAGKRQPLLHLRTVH